MPGSSVDAESHRSRRPGHARPRPSRSPRPAADPDRRTARGSRIAPTNPPTTTTCDVGRGRAHHQLLRMRTGGAGAVGPHRDEIGGGADGEPAAGRADRGVRDRRGRRHRAAGERRRAARAPADRRTRARAPGRTGRRSRADRRRATAGRRPRRAAARTAARRRDRPRWSGRSPPHLAPAEDLHVGVGQVGAVHESRPRAEGAGVGEQAVGVGPVAASASSFSAGCSDRCACSTRSSSAACGDRRQLGAAAPRAPSGCPRRPGRRSGSAATRSPRIARRAVREPLLRRGHRHAETAGQVGDVDQREPDSRLAGRIRDRQPHRVRVVVPAAARRMMQVVELADRRVSGAQQLHVAGAAPAPAGCPGRADRPAGTSVPARSRTCRRRRGSARAAPGGRCASARRRTPAPPRPAAARPARRGRRRVDPCRDRSR